MIRSTLITVGAMVRAGSPVLQHGADVLRRLSVDTGRSSSLTQYTRTFGTVTMTVTVPDLEVIEPDGPRWSFPVIPPLGSGIMALETPDAVEPWIDQLPDVDARKTLRSFLDAIRVSGVGVWRFDDEEAGLMQFLDLMRTVGPGALRHASPTAGDRGVIAHPLGRMLAGLGIQLAPFGYTSSTSRRGSPSPT
jgi:hypothetical protein